MEYGKVYFQKELSGSRLIETSEFFDIYCAEMPFVVCGAAKALTERDWHDEHGKDVYVPSQLKMEAYDFTATFCCKGDKFSSNTKINQFISYLAMKTGVYFKIYDTYTQIGRQHVRFLELSDDATLVRDGDGDILQFKVKFSVDDPVTSVFPKTDASGNITSLVTYNYDVDGIS